MWQWGLRCWKDMFQLRKEYLKMATGGKKKPCFVEGTTDHLVWTVESKEVG